MKRFSSALLVFVSLLTSSFLLLPVLALFLHVSWHHLWGIWVEDGKSPFFVSIETTCITMIVVLVFGTPLGWALARGKSRVWRVLEYLLLIPLLMPPLAIGLLLIYFYGPYGFIGELLSHWQLSAVNTMLAVVIAQVYESAPYYIYAVQGAFRQVDGGYEQLSYSLGVSPGRTFWRITLPLALPGVGVGITMAFARAIGAYGAIIVVAYNPHTLPVSIWVALEEQGLPVALPMALLLMLTALPLPMVTVLWRRIRSASTEA